MRRQGPNVAAGIAAPGFSDPSLGASAWNVNLASLNGCFSRKARHDDAEDHEHPDVGLFTVNMLAPALKFKRRSEHESALESLRATKRVCTTDEPVTAGAVGGAEGGPVTLEPDFGTDLYQAVGQSSGTAATLATMAVLLQIIVKRLEVVEVANINYPR